jgi:uncharacterized cupredoxin-like copper-binding protein
MTRIGLFFAACIAALVAGCGSSSSSSPSTSGSGAAATTTTATSSSASKPASTLTLTETEFKIAPASPTVKGGSLKITVKNAGKITHAFTINAPSGPVSSGDIAPGASATITVDTSKAGSYTFICPIVGHARLGMKGALIVGGASAAASGGAAVAATSATSSTASATSSGSGGAYGGSGGSGY